MKQKIIYISLFILILSVNSFGFSERRQQWWELRLENLKQEHAGLEKNPNKIIRSILEKDIDTTENVIKVFNSNLTDPEDINSGRKKYSDDETKNISGRYAEAAINLKYLSQILKYNQFNEWNDHTKLFLQSYTYKYLNRHFPNIEESFAAEFAAENMMDYYRKYLVLEAILQKSINNFNLISAAATAEITDAVVTEANSEDNFLYDYQLKKITEKKIN